MFNLNDLKNVFTAKKATNRVVTTSKPKDLEMYCPKCGKRYNQWKDVVLKTKPGNNENEFDYIDVTVGIEEGKTKQDVINDIIKWATTSSDDVITLYSQSKELQENKAITKILRLLSSVKSGTESYGPRCTNCYIEESKLLSKQTSSYIFESRGKTIINGSWIRDNVWDLNEMMLTDDSIMNHVILPKFYNNNRDIVMVYDIHDNMFFVDLMNKTIKHVVEGE